MAKQKSPLQIRIVPDDERRRNLIEKLQIIAEANNLSVNDVANMAVSAGLPVVEQKLGEILEPLKAA